MAVGIGDPLRAARRRRNRSLSDSAAHTRIGEPHPVVAATWSAGEARCAVGRITG